jgi:type III restriction enzyme
VIDLFQFQRQASSQMADRFLEYQGNEVLKGTKNNPQSVPFFQSLAALTGAGKTVILADAVRQMAAPLAVAPVILWLSKGRVVVEQSYANLSNGGKYNHLLGKATVRLLNEYDPADVEVADKPTVFFATVGTFNQKDMEGGNRNIFKADIDTTGTSTWEALADRKDSAGLRRPLFVVYDEAQNLSEQQTDLLLRQQPDAFLLASATMRLPQLMVEEIDHLRRSGRTDDWLVTSVPSSTVVSQGLVKSTLSLAGYKSPMEETVSAMLADMKDAEADAAEYGVDTAPKAIYVCKTNVLADDAYRKDNPQQPFGQRQAPPILIWRYLTEHCGVDASEIAVYANLDVHKNYPLPPEFVLYGGGEKDYTEFASGGYKHVIFNLTLQEGWDDPDVYFAYIDKSMESSVQITQVIGRVLRQPGATHYAPERLNTAHFYVRVDRNETFSDVLSEVASRLGQDAPEIRIVAAAPGASRAKELKPKIRKEIPRTALSSQDAVLPVETLLAGMLDYSDSVKNTVGVGSRKLVQQAVGAATQIGQDWEDYEESNKVSARWVFHREVLRLFPRALDVASTADERFDVQIGVGSRAFDQVKDLARRVVQAYVENVCLVQRKPNPFVVGPILVRDGEIERFTNALHAGYEDLNDLERAYARSLDKTGLAWFRNPPRSGYGIPLVSVGDTSNFYPDFVVWTDTKVICVDTKAPHILQGEAGRKLLNVQSRTDTAASLQIRFATPGEFNSAFEKLSNDGCTLWGLKSDGTKRAQHFATIDLAVVHLVGSTA